MEIIEQHYYISTENTIFVTLILSDFLMLVAVLSRLIDVRGLRSVHTKQKKVL